MRLHVRLFDALADAHALACGQHKKGIAAKILDALHDEVDHHAPSQERRDEVQHRLSIERYRFEEFFGEDFDRKKVR